MTRMLGRLYVAVLVVSVALCTRAAFALPIAFTDRVAFDTAVAALPAANSLSTLDFESLAPGTLIASGTGIGGITFSYDFGGVQMMVSDAFSTTSPPNFLGTNDAGVFQSGDDFSLSFAPTNAFGMYFITADTLLDGDISLTAGGATASLAASQVLQTLPDGSLVFFLGLVDMAATFASANVTSTCCGLFFFNVDDIVRGTVVPEPGTMALLGIGLAGLNWRRRRDVS